MYLLVLGQIEVVIGRRAVERGCAAPRNPSLAEMIGERLRDQQHRPVQHRDIHVLSAAGLMAREQRREHADRRVQPTARVVGEQVLRNRRRLVLAPDHRERARLRDIVEVVTDEVAIRPGLAEAGHRAIDQPRVARREHREVDPKPLGDAGAELLDHHVGALRQAQEDLAPCPALEIEPDRFLVPPKRVVHAQAGRRALRLARGRGLLGAPSRRCPWFLDLDDIRAKVAEDHRAMRTGCELGEVDNLDTAERCD